MPPQDYWLFFVAALAGVFRFWRKRRAVGKGGGHLYGLHIFGLGFLAQIAI